MLTWWILSEDGVGTLTHNYEIAYFLFWTLFKGRVSDPGGIMKVVSVFQEEEMKCHEWYVRGLQDHSQTLWFPRKTHRTQKLLVIDYYSEKIQIKFRKDKGHREQSPGEIRHLFLLSSPRGMAQLVLKSHKNKIWQVGQGDMHGLCGWPWLFSFQPSEVALVQHGPYGDIRYIVGISGMAQGLRHTKTLLSGRIFQALEVFSQELVKGQFFFWFTGFE